VSRVALLYRPCSGQAAGLVVAVRCDMRVLVLMDPSVMMWAHCLVCQGEPSCPAYSATEALFVMTMVQCCDEVESRVFVCLSRDASA
jgi:hypothetical protein